MYSAKALQIFTANGSDGSIVFSIIATFFLSVNRITHEHVPRQALEAYWLSRSLVKGQDHVGFFVHDDDNAWTSWPGFTKSCTGIPLIQCRGLLNMQTLRQTSHTLGSKMWCLSVTHSALGYPRAVLGFE